VKYNLSESKVMNYSEMFVCIIIFSFIGIIASGVLCHCFEDIERKRGFPFTKQFWAEFKIGTWVLLGAFAISVDVLVIIKIVEWVKL
jgi:hypothetical protein